jgi:catechol 2,3-dioxygenase-like lactoylglutathione lyase family enzyme
VPRRSTDPLANPPGLDHLSFAVADVDSVCARLSAAGAEFDAPPADTDWGARIACLRDPDGTSVFLLTWQIPPAPVTAPNVATGGALDR